MAMPGAFHRSTALQALTILSVLAVLVADHVQGRNHRHDCPSFPCGHLRDVAYPFRRRGDPPGCGVQSYELACSDSKATLRIDDAIYYVKHINYSDQTFWVVDANLDNSSCPLPLWSRHPYGYRGYEDEDEDEDEVEVPSRISTEVELEPATYCWWATFVNCSQVIKSNGMYRPVACLSTSYAFVYVLSGSGPNYYSTSYYMENLEPSCGYLAMTPLGGGHISYDMESLWPSLQNVSYANTIKLMRNGFAVRFPFTNGRSIKWCLAESIDSFREKRDILSIDIDLLLCVTAEIVGITSPSGFYYITTAITVQVLWLVIWIAVLCRFVLMPLAVLIFLAHKYWRTRITIDAVEKFLRMQQMLGPTRYAYTDIIAITRHFRDKLGQGGYGSVYKGVLLPGEVLVAVKMLASSNCNGEEFISEVSTIGRIHHINVVRLVGFCSEEIRRALVYEYMPHGSLDKYIFSAEKSFSWDKLNEIALGIARGINYLHQGCDMQILHFDIKPHNILLDSNFVPKVADFGLAKLYPRDNSFVPLSALRGTVGYIAPEMISRSFGIISSKSDVYSFGMLLLEMAGGRRNADPNAANSSQAYYPSWVYSRLARREMGEIADSVVDMHELERKLCVIGLRCIQMKSHDRPTMSEVIEMLEGGADDGLQVPPKPFFCEDEQFPAVQSYHFSSEPELTEISEEDE